MILNIEKDKIVLQNSEYFDVKKTLECGQIFRYRCLSPKSYEVFSLSHRAQIETLDKQTIIYSSNPHYFANFFDLSTDYSQIENALSKFSELEKYLIPSRGIRILRQDLFESIISFIISANNNIPRIQGIIEKICAFSGKNLGGYFAFPDPCELKELKEENYRAFGAGFRSPYLEQTVKVLCDTDFLSSLSALDTKSAIKMLTSLKGVGAKVANCVALFGLNRTDCYPSDTWIFNAHKTDFLNTPEKVCDYFTNRYGNFAGYAQQYVFYCKRNLLL